MTIKDTFASLVERMNKQIAEWDEDEPRGDWWQYQRDFATAADTIARLRAALEPFIRHGRAIGAYGDDPGPYWIMTDEGHRDVPAEDFHNARAALEGEG